MAKPAELHITSDENGTRWWKLPNGELHREDGPAYLRTDGCQAWYKYGKIHREDGPAVIYEDRTSDYFLNGFKLREGDLALKIIKAKEKRNGATNM